jgi:hypothetical protein
VHIIKITLSLHIDLITSSITSTLGPKGQLNVDFSISEAEETFQHRTFNTDNKTWW